MSEDFVFPINPFEDVKPSDFNKLNKKHVTEDFVEENFKKLGWEVYKPFSDTGIDRIICKTVCPKGHTKLNETLNGKKCPKCNSTGVEIRRFLQVKTRELKNNIFGFTLKSKDIRIDPRHIYLLYSDNTSKDKQDFFIIPVKEYLKFFIDNDCNNPFAPTSFRKGNNKLNSLRYNPETDEWFWGDVDWDGFRNKNGLKNLQNPSVDLDLDNQIIKTREYADALQREFSKGRSYSEEVEDSINDELKEKLSLYSSPEEILELRKKVEKKLKETCDKITFESMKKYFEFIKTIEAIGEDEVNEEEIKEEINKLEDED